MKKNQAVNKSKSKLKIQTTNQSHIFVFLAFFLGDAVGDRPVKYYPIRKQILWFGFVPVLGVDLTCKLGEPACPEQGLIAH